MDAGADDCGSDAGGKVAIASEADARTRSANIGNQFFMARTVEHDDHEIFDVAIKTSRNGFQVVGDGSIEFASALARWPDDQLFHVAIRGMQQAVAFTGGQD